jgi:hypothetical protein
MRVLSRRPAKAILLLLLTVFTVYQFQQQWTKKPTVSPEDVIPAQGRAAEIDTKGLVPGNPDNAVQDMKQLRALMRTYQENNKKLPKDFNALWLDMRRNPQSYGYNSIEEAQHIYTNPDSRYSDFRFLREEPDFYSPYTIQSTRPDGTPLSNPKTPGKRDILIYTDIYVHQNIRHYPGERSTSNPVGFFLVMWDDGQIEKIPYDRQLYVPVDKNTWNFAVPGQAGVPANALTYDQFYQKLGARKGPRGKAGGKGLSYEQF